MKVQFLLLTLLNLPDSEQVFRPSSSTQTLPREMLLRGKLPSRGLFQPYQLNRICLPQLPTLSERTNQLRPARLFLRLKGPALQHGLPVQLAIIRPLKVATGAPFIPGHRKHAPNIGKFISTANKMSAAICMKCSFLVQDSFTTIIDFAGLLYGLDFLMEGQD